MHVLGHATQSWRAEVHLVPDTQEGGLGEERRVVTSVQLGSEFPSLSLNLPFVQDETLCLANFPGIVQGNEGSECDRAGPSALGASFDSIFEKNKISLGNNCLSTGG